MAFENTVSASPRHQNPGGKQKQLRLFFCHEHHSLLLFDGISIHHA